MDKNIEAAIETLLPERRNGGVKLGWLFLGVGLGALGAYMLDPDRGRRRQEQVREQITQVGSMVQREAPAKLQLVQDKVKDIQQEVQTAISRTTGGEDTQALSPDAESDDNGESRGA